MSKASKKQKPAANSVKIPESLRPVLKALMDAEEQGQIMQERVQAAIAIEKGIFASQLKQALVGALVQAAGNAPGPMRLSPDLSTILLPPAPPKQPEPPR